MREDHKQGQIGADEDIELPENAGFPLLPLWVFLWYRIDGLLFTIDAIFILQLKRVTLLERCHCCCSC